MATLHTPTRHTLIAALVALLGLPAPAMSAAPASEPPLAGSSCPTGQLVDATFRDRALAEVERLLVRAPGSPAHGAVRVHRSPAWFDAEGRSWHLVSAYAVNLGLIGALRVSPRLLPAVADWLRWQSRHSPAAGPTRGVVIDHWVRADDLQESTCPAGIAPAQCNAVDAHDSTAASTLLMAGAYLQHGGDAKLLREPAMRRALEDAAAAMTALTSAIGLTVAMPSHPVAYTMDAVEVIAGFRAWARVQNEVYAQPQSAEVTLASAARVEATLRERLWDQRAQSWQVSLGAGVPKRDRWYPDTVAQAWPLLWGQTSTPPDRTRDAWRRAIAPWQRSPRLHWAFSQVDPAGFWWPAVAVAALCTGDDVGARAWVARARQAWLDPLSPFAWPFQVGDLLWLLWLADPQPPEAIRAVPVSLDQHHSIGALR